MPDISYTISGQVQKGAFSQSFAASGVTADIATSGLVALTLNLSTAVSTISTTNISAVGMAFVRSLATTTTHTVSFGRLVSGTLYETVRLKAGEAAVLRLAPGDYAAKADVAGSGARIWVTIYGD